MAKELDKKQKKSVSGGKSKGSSGGEGDPCRTHYTRHQSVKPSTEKIDSEMPGVAMPRIFPFIAKCVNKNKVNHN